MNPISSSAACSQCARQLQNTSTALEQPERMMGTEPGREAVQREQRAENTLHLQRDRVEISQKARDLMLELQERSQRQDARDTEGKSATQNGTGELSQKEQREVEALRKRDREVRAHEQAHLAAAGGYALGGPQFEFETGPDGKRYAVGGEVPIDVSEVPNDPRATLQKAATIRRAALAPNEPSGPDRAIAAKAASMAAKARQEMVQEPSNGSGKGGAEPAAASRTPEGTREESGKGDLSRQRYEPGYWPAFSREGGEVPENPLASPAF